MSHSGGQRSRHKQKAASFLLMRQPFADFDALTPDFSSHIQQDFSPADILTSCVPVAPDFGSHIQQDFSPADILTSCIPVAPDFSYHIQQDFSPADIQTSCIPVAPDFGSHIQQDFSPADILTSCIPVAPDFSPGRIEIQKISSGFSPISSCPVRPRLNFSRFISPARTILRT